MTSELRQYLRRAVSDRVRAEVESGSGASPLLLASDLRRSSVGSSANAEVQMFSKVQRMLYLTEYEYEGAVL